jgi:hypothetical protein
MRTSYSFGSMDKQTFDWLTLCIETAPDIYSLDGIRVTIEWFYDMDKDFESFELLLNKINEQIKTLTNATPNNPS